MSTRDAFVAIADPTRRDILVLVRSNPNIAANEIARHFACSRPAISRHLRVLRECGVVSCARRGKEQHYVVNPEPLQVIRDGFLANFATMHVESLKSLRRRVSIRPHDEVRESP